MTKEQLEHFRQVLEDEKRTIIEKMDQMKRGDIHTQREDMLDDADAASVEVDHNLLFRIRGREIHLIKKIDEALEKMDQGTYGICDACGEEINIARLEARPVAPLCISCKEEQEKMEKRRGS
ncbi:MAG: RNA polymerase-binding protein DksA [Deltaproteobacteria bacterium]|nr:RNA polymerase-binding protein DksA [Candidatus Anaeroferrophillacea bacterium]